MTTQLATKATQTGLSPILAGTLYERYYGLPLDRVLNLNDIEKPRYGAPTSPGFAALCLELAGASNDGQWSVPRNGTIIEQIPDIDEAVEPGTVVALVVSRGKQTVTVLPGGTFGE